MTEQKLAALVQRVEQASQGAMTQQKFEELVNRLENAVNKLGSGAVQAAPKEESKSAAASQPVASGASMSGPYLQAISGLPEKLMAAAEKFGNAQVTDACKDFVQLAKDQAHVMDTMATFGMPDNIGFLGAKNGELTTKHDTVIKKDRKSLRDHLQVVIMGISIFNWPFFQDIASFDEGFSSYLDEYKMPGNKVLRKNNDVETDWYNAFNDLCQAIGKFLMARKETCWKWTGSQAGSGAAAFFASKCGSEPSAAPQQAQEVKPVAKAAAPKKAAPKEKKPFKEMDFRGTWTVENYKDDTINLGEGEISHKHQLRAFSCSNTVFNINGKVKMAMFEGCTGLTINIESSVSPIEMVNCKRCRIFATKSIPFITFDKASDCIVHLFQETRKCVVSTSQSTTIKVKWPKEGASNTSEEDSDWCGFSVPEIFETRIGENDKAVTEPYLEDE